MTIQKMSVGQLQTNCYLVWGDDNVAAVIDPGDNAEWILSQAQQKGLKIEAVLLTHLHIDHFLAVPEIVAATAAQLIIPKDEAPALQDDARSLMSWLRSEYRFSLSPDRLVGEGDTVNVGSLAFTVWHTPGHTAGSSCYVCEDTIFSGDTLFEGSCGRIDLPSGDSLELRRSLLRLGAVKEDYRVMPGHGSDTTLQREKSDNPFMK